MLHVASAKLQALKQSHGHGAKPSSSNERPQGAFESMLDDNAAQASPSVKDATPAKSTTASKEPAAKDNATPAERPAGPEAKAKIETPEGPAPKAVTTAAAGQPAAEPKPDEVAIAPEEGEKPEQATPAADAPAAAALPLDILAAMIADAAGNGAEDKKAEDKSSDGENNGDTAEASATGETAVSLQPAADQQQAATPALPPAAFVPPPATGATPQPAATNDAPEAQVTAVGAAQTAKPQPVSMTVQPADIASADAGNQATTETDTPVEAAAAAIVPEETIAPAAGKKHAAKTPHAEPVQQTADLATEETSPEKPGVAAQQAETNNATTAAKTASPSPSPSPSAAPADLEHIARARGEKAEDGQGDKARAVSATLSSNLTAPDLSTPTPHTAAHLATHAGNAAALTQNVQASTAPQAQPQTPAPVMVPLAGVGVEIASKAAAGKTNFEIRLDPPELGRIDVRLNVDRDGNVTSTLIADRQDTLDLLKRDSAGLERALQDAGLKTSDNGMQFSLRDQSFNQRQEQSGQSSKTAQLVVADETAPKIDVPVTNYGRLAGRMSGLDIRV